MAQPKVKSSLNQMSRSEGNSGVTANHRTEGSGPRSAAVVTAGLQLTTEAQGTAPWKEKSPHFYQLKPNVLKKGSKKIPEL